MKEKLLGKTLEELKQAAQTCGLKPFVGKQLAEWLYAKRACGWDQMSNISKESKARLQEKYDLGVSGPIGVAVSRDGTKKYLFPVTNQNNVTTQNTVTTENIGATQNIEATQNAVEAVMIPEDDRRTLCVSSQAGCKMGCRFCMTGRQGWHGNLDTAEILSQFLGIDEATDLTNAVFMGMGEPLDNYEAVKKAIDILTADWGFGWSPKRITVSTVGDMPNLKRFLDETRCHLAVSLHNAFSEERFSMMPVEKNWRARDVLELIRKYDFGGQRRVSFEYTMFEGWNDDLRHADALGRLLNGLECRVNLIRFHKIPDFPYGTSSSEVMEAFKNRLTEKGIICTIRASRGEDILAACGMLAGKHSSRV